MANEKYILDADGNVVSADLMTWANWYESNYNKRSIGKDEPIPGVKVSTVFLGLNHNFGDGPPVLWETMIFGGEHDQYQERYSTRKEALEGHRRAVELATQLAAH